MKTILACLLVLWSVPAQAAITLVAGTDTCNGSSDTATASVTVDSTTGTLAVVQVSDFTGVGTVSDSKFQTWDTTLTTATNGSGYKSKLYFAVLSATDAAHVFTYTGVASYPTLCVLIFAGTHATTPYTSQESSNTASAQTIQPGSLTPSEANCVLVTGLNTSENSAVTYTASPFTVGANQVLFSAGNHFGGMIAYQIQTTATAVNPTWDPGGGGADLESTMAVFKSAAGGGGGATPCHRNLLGVGCHDQ